MPAAWGLADVDAFLSKEWEPLSAFDTVMAVVFIGLILEAVRRTDGMALVFVIMGFTVHALFANHSRRSFGPPTPGCFENPGDPPHGHLGLPIMVMVDL
jgi:TRAP-type uncharacterized transport system fused permease subunit